MRMCLHRETSNKRSYLFSPALLSANTSGMYDNGDETEQ